MPALPPSGIFKQVPKVGFQSVGIKSPPLFNTQFEAWRFFMRNPQAEKAYIE